MYLSFRDAPVTVHLDGCDDLFEAIAAVARRWPFRVLDGAPDDGAVIRFRPSGGGYIRSSPWVEDPDVDDDAADAMVDFVSDLIDSHLESRPEFLALHCAALVLPDDDALTVFPNTHKAGKSLMTVLAASRGATVFSDDVLPLQPDGAQGAMGRAMGRARGHALGVALGVAPRLRLPLPVDVAEAARKYIVQQGMVANDRYGYVLLPDDRWAAQGTRAPVRNIVVLNHDRGALPVLEPISAGEALKGLIERNFAYGHQALSIFDRLHHLADAAACYRLSYDSPNDGLDHLLSALGERT